MMDRDIERNVALFLVIAFGISWLLWLPELLVSNGVIELPEAVGLFGMFAPFGPFVAAFWLMYRAEGFVGVKKLWKRGWSLNFKKIWLLPTILIMPVAGIITVFILQIMGEPVQWEYGISGVALLPTFTIIYLLNALPEEYGWRGYALEPLMKRNSALVASLILGLLWGLWHLPLHFIEGTVQANIPVYQFILHQMVLAVFYTWLYVNTRGVVLVAILFHAIGNIVGAAVPYWVTDQGRWINFGVLVMFAFLILLYWGPNQLKRNMKSSDSDVPLQ